MPKQSANADAQQPEADAVDSCTWRVATRIRVCPNRNTYRGIAHETQEEVSDGCSCEAAISERGTLPLNRLRTALHTRHAVISEDTADCPSCAASMHELQHNVELSRIMFSTSS